MSSENPDETVCPNGYICDFANETLIQPLRKYSCRDLQQEVKDNGYGDILAGIYCRNGTLEDGGATIKNCPAGHYCPDPFEDPIKCKAGYYCPVKSANEVTYRCRGCKEGATSFAIHVPLLVVLFVLIAAIVSFVKFVEHRQKKELQKDKAPQTSFKFVQQMKPILQMIDERLGDAFVNKVDANGNIIGFKSDLLYDAIDANGDGTISYEELDKAMALTGTQLSVFIQKMNEAAGYPDNATTVSRECFVRYFFETIRMASNFDPTPEHAEIIYDSMEGADKNQVILDAEHFIKSNLSTFLSEKQILRLIRLFLGRAVVRDEEEMQAITEDPQDGNMPLRSSSKKPVKIGSKKKSLRVTFVSQKVHYITKEVFVQLYPILLRDLVQKVQEEKRHMFDIHFEKLSLIVKVKGGEKAVVNNVTGRIRSGTMTALMGGSGAGKTSLLNALCGRAHYGETSGIIHVNGNLSKIEECTDGMGFVPQDDIVYAELTVKENLVFAGKLKLPRGTPSEYINDLADDVIADLGLTRVAGSIVGDVTRRGVSGGEKKRVNIGLELMSKPSILFLDEPTSGLDSSSAMIVMGSLSKLVQNQGMTVCTVIHQPRKQIFDMFDSLILLGFGGNMVYHGPATEAKDYFFNLGYDLGQGESLADWMIDISSGELSPSLYQPPGAIEDESGQHTEVVPSGDNSTDDTGKVESGESEPLLDNNGSDNNEDFSPAENRERLYGAWNGYFSNISDGEKDIYDRPSPVSLPPDRAAPTFLLQVWNQLQRCLIIFQRNISTKIQETMLIVVGTIVIAAIEGPLELTTDVEPQIPEEYYVLTSVGKDPGRFDSGLPFLFQHATQQAESILGYAGKVSVIIAILVTLSTAKVLTDKRIEFFREAASGYNINAYFLAVVVFTTFEVTVKMIITSLFSYAMRSSAATAGSTVLHFILLGWVSSAWGFLWPLVVSPNSIFLVVAFSTVFSCLMLSGNPGAAITYSNIYRDSGLNAFVAGMLAPSRYFIEGTGVAEMKALGVQHGFTEYIQFVDDDEPMTSKLLSVGFNSTSLGMSDPFIFEESRGGWYWGVLPALLVGLSIRLLAFVMLQLNNRTQMLKAPIMKDSRSNKIRFFLLFAVCAACVGTSIFSFMHDSSDPLVLCEKDQSYFADLLENEGDSCPREYNTPRCRFADGLCDNFNEETAIVRKFRDKYPNCCDDSTSPTPCRFVYLSLDDDYCDSYEPNNSEECGWDDGHCLVAEYPDCKGIYPGELGDNRCRGWSVTDVSLNTPECGYDAGDCSAENEKLWQDYPNCTGVYPGYIGNDNCDGGRYNTAECGYDGRDCETANAWLWEKYPSCNLQVDPNEIRNGRCESSYPYNTDECGYDGGDCDAHNAEYPGCVVDNVETLGDLVCNKRSNTTECNYDGGDCLVEGYPNCILRPLGNTSMVGDGICHKQFNNEECGYDDGDCSTFNTDYPKCDASDPHLIGNGVCNEGLAYWDKEMNTPECGYDGGDCLAFNRDYPYCDEASSRDILGNGVCDRGPASYYQEFNSIQCGFEYGDCTKFNSDYPECDSGDVSNVGNGVCDEAPGYPYNSINIPQCGNDGGDCDAINEKYPECVAGDMSKVGNGVCDEGPAYRYQNINTPACGFEDGDCEKFNTDYPECAHYDVSTFGNNVCDMSLNTPECGFDKGDCDAFNAEYPGCVVSNIEWLNNGHCDRAANTTECKNDGGDCVW